MPAYNAAETLERTIREIDLDLVDKIIVVDDCSKDKTAEEIDRLKVDYPIQKYVHQENKGYGGNQKSCYRLAVEEGADIVIMVHPDYQYTPKLIPAIVGMLSSGLFDVCLASRILGGKALEGGMPLIKYIANRALTFIQNICLGNKLSEYHTGYRAFKVEVLKKIDFYSMSDDFIFDNEFLVACHIEKFKIGELTCPTKYFPEASSINLWRSSVYAIGCMKLSLKYIFKHRLK